MERFRLAVHREQHQPTKRRRGADANRIRRVMSSGSAAPYGFVVKRVSSSRNVNLEIFAPEAGGGWTSS